MGVPTSIWQRFVGRVAGDDTTTEETGAERRTQS
jgi:hypothetical protein